LCIIKVLTRKVNDDMNAQEKEAWENKHYTKSIDCPFEGHEGHKATVYEHGHRYAGVIECDATGESDSCEHPDTRVEETEDWPTSPLDNPTPYPIYVCNICECTAEGDPREDAHDAMVDSQIMQALGK